MVYIFSESPLEISDSSIQLVDTKVTYSKAISNPIETSSDIRTYTGEMNEQLLKLAFESGVYSRFKSDTRLRQNEFQKLYEIWVKKAWESNAILEVPELRGMVSFSMEEKSASIGLIAVDKDSQGKGWGKKLMKAAEAYAAIRGSDQITVVTQEGNFPACRLYESLGYQLVEKVYVYHYWAGNQID
ncbi:GNAT family N-acetyltransferase [Algoriphagus antarcticus]|uniref:Acetyltransferase (GNAT) family protein n=1 Tax=Algoriphagus antarcticus TaxID=238540 RepID=A0A3E0DZI9_9BACT|nr:GNAT family N-acetyltransferase [Algoriphagus antarcticus]REG91504.1 acetyltransferase (GNAT) family protein [Algoriphagus antarcticus]